MRFHWQLTLRAMATLLSVWSCSAAIASDAPLTVVNGVVIAASLLERNVQANTANGRKDTPELRAALKQELIARELMTQEAQKRGLDKLPTTQEALQVIRQNFLIELVLNDEFTKNPMTDAELKAEYERQVKLLKASGDLQQFQVFSIVLPSETEARSVMASLKSGQAFDVVAKSKSIDPSKDKGGELGWFLPDQIAPPIANVIVNLLPGNVSAAPIQVGPYWHVIKLVAKRPYQIPNFEDSKKILQATVSQNRRAALLKKLNDAAVLK
jgi:peptidyl-prolyl cis-trans isomerase C